MLQSGSLLGLPGKSPNSQPPKSLAGISSQSLLGVPGKSPNSQPPKSPAGISSQSARGRFELAAHPQELNRSGSPSAALVAVPADAVGEPPRMYS
eukprot:366458-Chlamydomonas_euryale.AAC.22